MTPPPAKPANDAASYIANMPEVPEREMVRPVIHVDWKPAKDIPDWGAALAVGDRRCIFQVDHHSKMVVGDCGNVIA